ncbi:MAG: NAD-dependent epimerase/dehydratase family protein [Thermoplasmata archaeon]
MNPSPPVGRRPRVLIVGGTGGLVGRALLEEFRSDHVIRSVHRHANPAEQAAGVEWVPTDIATVPDWRPLLKEVDVVVNVAWYRFGPDRRFRPLKEGLVRLVETCDALGDVRFVHISVPPATESVETHLPYMVRKREVDAAVARSHLAYSIIRPTMLFGPRDKLLTVMLRTARRWHRLPIFGNGEYHVSPIAVRDLARIVRREAEIAHRATVTAGGPERWRYRDLCELLFRSLGLPPRYLSMSPAGGYRLARVLETVGSTLLYAYEVEWLVSDLLGLEPYVGLGQPLEPVEGFLQTEAAPFRRRPGAGPSP